MNAPSNANTSGLENAGHIVWWKAGGVNYYPEGEAFTVSESCRVEPLVTAASAQAAIDAEKARADRAESRIAELATLFGVCDGGRYLNDWKAALAAAPASPLPGGGWQDISTAPKDGTIILTYGSLHNDGAPYGIGEKPTVKISQYSQEGEFWCCDAWGSHEPVWWMPLPAAPTGEPK